MKSLMAQNNEMTKFIKDLRDNGLRFDLNPTYVGNKDSLSVHEFYLNYLKRIEDSITERSRNVIRAVEREE